MLSLSTHSEVARRALKKHEELHSFDHYTGILTLQALAHLAVATDSADLIAHARRRLLPFVEGKRSFYCNFKNYLCGGNGAAFLLWRGHLPEAEESVRRHAEELMHAAPRDRAGIFSNPLAPEKEQVWIDVAFAVTPFLLFAGLALKNDACIEEAFQQTRKMVELFRDPANGLLHQCRGFSMPDKITADHWSRGNGWAMLALTELIDWLPAKDPRRPAAEKQFKDLIEACLAVQGANGLWHHEMTLPSSFVETSGSGLILHGLGVGIARGVLTKEKRTALQRGLEGYLDYIDEDGSVQNTCQGCRSPGDGSILAYLKMQPVTNDPHAFGPVMLAFTAALRAEQT